MTTGDCGDKGREKRAEIMERERMKDFVVLSDLNEGVCGTFSELPSALA